jgi:hypothetical protein
MRSARETKIAKVCFLKGQSNEIFYLWFFHWWTPLKPLTRFLKTFRIWLRIQWDIHDIWMTLRCNIYCSGESIFPVLFTTESCDSPHHFGGESPFVSIICIKSRLSFNTESQYSPDWLLRRVTTPHLIYSGESLLTAESYCQKIWRTPPSFKGTVKQKMDYPCRVLLTKNI